MAATGAAHSELVSSELPTHCTEQEQHQPIIASNDTFHMGPVQTQEPKVNYMDNWP